MDSLPRKTEIQSYVDETSDILRQFLREQIEFPVCISELDAALARLVFDLEQSDLPELRRIMLANNEAIMNEIARREEAKSRCAR